MHNVNKICLETYWNQQIKWLIQSYQHVSPRSILAGPVLLHEWMQMKHHSQAYGRSWHVISNPVFEPTRENKMYNTKIKYQLNNHGQLTEIYHTHLIVCTYRSQVWKSKLLLMHTYLFVNYILFSLYTHKK